MNHFYENLTLSINSLIHIYNILQNRMFWLLRRLLHYLQMLIILTLLLINKNQSQMIIDMIDWLIDWMIEIIIILNQIEYTHFELLLHFIDSFEFIHSYIFKLYILLISYKNIGYNEYTKIDKNTLFIWYDYWWKQNRYYSKSRINTSILFNNTNKWIKDWKSKQQLLF